MGPSVTDRRLIGRLLIIALAMAAAWSGLGFRLASLHLGPNQKLQERVRRMHHLEKTILVGRGRIFDAKGRNLAVDLPVCDICVDPQVIKEGGHVQAVGTCLARALEMDAAEVVDRIARPPGPRYACLKKSVQHDVAERINRMRLPGVWTPDTTARYYPHGRSLSHVIGFSNLEGIGSAGVEMRMNRFLKGRPGLREIEKDGRRSEVYSRRGIDVPPQAGCDVFLTVDLNIQYLVEKALDRALVEHGAKGAWAVVQQVKTGRILAMAGRPDYDLNAYRRTPQDAMLNRCIGYTYEPGSTMKALVFAAAFNEGIVSEHELVDCENGIWFYRGRPLRDYHPYGELTVADVLKKSSNIGTAKLALRLGEERLERYLRAFGIGRPAGIDLPGEETGLLAPRDRWSALSISRIPMGHEVAVTALQMASAYSAIANDGFLLRPLIVDRVQNPEGGLIFKSEPEVVARPISDAASRTLRRLLMRVTEDGGTASRARVDGYSVAGKTGTAEKVVDGNYDRSANVASFVGFIPAEYPELTIIAVVDEPQPIHTGGRVAAPVFKEIAEQVVRYLAVPPEGSDNLFPLVADEGPVADPASGDRT